MAPEGVAICWGLKEPAYGAAPLLPALDQVLPQELAALEQQVSQCHAVHGSEISFYWCFPFWVLSVQLQKKGIQLAGLSDFEAARRIPQLIVLVDLPLQRSDLQRLISRYPRVPLVLLVAETPLERQAQHCEANLRCFSAVLSYNRRLGSHCPQLQSCNLPFRFSRGSHHAGKPVLSPTDRSIVCTYVGNAHSSGWRRNYQYKLGWRGWPLLWQYMQGWRLPLAAAWRDERHGAYGVRAGAVLAAHSVFGSRFLLCGKSWGNGGSGWFSRWFPDRRLKLQSHELGLAPGSKITALRNSRFTLACENYLGDPGYVSEKLFDAMAAGSIPIYIGAPGSLPAKLNDAVIDLSHLHRSVLRCPIKLSTIFSEIAAIPDNELLYRQQACLQFMDQSYEQLWGLEPFLKAFDHVLDVLAPCASS
jgi:hypothetical protein